MNNNSSIRPKRHWSSIRLGYLLLVVTAVGFVLGQWILPAISQQQNVSQIKADGGWVLFSTEGDAAPSVVLKHFFPTEALIPIHSVGFEQYQMEIPSDSIRTLQQMPTVTSLYLRGRTVSSDSLNEIMKLENLEALDLSGSTVNDETLQILADHPSLKRILLAGSEVTKSGVELFFANSDIALSYWTNFRVQFSKDGKPVQPPLVFGETYDYELSAYRTEHNYIASHTYFRLYYKNGPGYGLSRARVSSRSVNDMENTETFEDGHITIADHRRQNPIYNPTKYSLEVRTSYGTIEIPIETPGQSDFEDE